MYQAATAIAAATAAAIVTLRKAKAGCLSVCVPACLPACLRVRGFDHEVRSDPGGASSAEVGRGAGRWSAASPPRPPPLCPGLTDCAPLCRLIESEPSEEVLALDRRPSPHSPVAIHPLLVVEGCQGHHR
jgi:hypothetical protein